MAVIQISRIQHRRGLQADLPNLASGELGWSVDTRQLYIGNGTIEEGAPSLGKTEILTQYSILDFTQGFGGAVTSLTSGVSLINANVSALSNTVANIAATITSTNVTLAANSSGTITAIPATNAEIRYTLTQGVKRRSGTLQFNRVDSTVGYEEDYNETATTDITLSANANVTHANINYTTTTTTYFAYQVRTV
jgi:hypothetical protein